MSIRMNGAYACTVRGDEIHSPATHVVTEYAQVPWANCAENTWTHATLHPDYPASAHTVNDHPVVVGTRLAAHRELLRIKRVQGVTGG